MPELPDINAYRHVLDERVVKHPIKSVSVCSPSLLRSVFDVQTLVAQPVVGIRRIGKQIVWEISDGRFLVFHLMVAGRFRWADSPPAKRPGKNTLAWFEFSHGTVLLTEAGAKRRASLHVAANAAELDQFDRGGLEVLAIDLPAFVMRARSENRTLKRLLTDPRLFSGIGNAYSDEILHRARLSPTLRSQSLDYAQLADLYAACQFLLSKWSERLLQEYAGRFPTGKDVTAFRPEFAVHGRYGQPCPVCTTLVQRICYASNETNYCPRCQTGGKLLSDRALARLLKSDWPRTIEELESGAGVRP